MAILTVWASQVVNLYFQSRTHCHPGGIAREAISIGGIPGGNCRRGWKEGISEADKDARVVVHGIVQPELQSKREIVVCIRRVVKQRKIASSVRDNLAVDKSERVRPHAEPIREGGLRSVEELLKAG